jgi:hypothetical protein
MVTSQSGELKGFYTLKLIEVEILQVKAGAKSALPFITCVAEFRLASSPAISSRVQRV